VNFVSGSLVLTVPPLGVTCMLFHMAVLTLPQKVNSLCLNLREDSTAKESDLSSFGR